MDKKYPVGTPIRYIGGNNDCGKVGKIVGHNKWNDPLIFLPESSHISCFSTLKTPASWQTSWGNIEILVQKNQQLLFDFAYWRI